MERKQGVVTEGQRIRKNRKPRPPNMVRGRGKMNWIVPLLPKIGVAIKPVKGFFSYIWDELKNDTFARVYFVLSLILVLLGAHGWWKYYTKPVGGTGLSASPVTVVVYKNKVVIDGEAHSKPPEGTTTITPSGEIAISRLGLTFVPKGGFVWVGDANIYGGARVFYFNRFGVEIMANNEMAFLGCDMRLPLLSNITVAAGAAQRYRTFADVSSAALYGGASFCLR
jgi:hypothetical protein